MPYDGRRPARGDAGRQRLPPITPATNAPSTYSTGPRPTGVPRRCRRWSRCNWPGRAPACEWPREGGRISSRASSKRCAFGTHASAVQALMQAPFGLSCGQLRAAARWAWLVSCFPRAGCGPLWWPGCRKNSGILWSLRSSDEDDLRTRFTAQEKDSRPLYAGLVRFPVSRANSIGVPHSGHLPLLFPVRSYSHLRQRDGRIRSLLKCDSTSVGNPLDTASPHVGHCALRDDPSLRWPMAMTGPPIAQRPTPGFSRT